MKNNGICDYKLKASRKQEPGESQSIRIQAETKQQRHDRLQIARDNTARRTTKQTATASTKCCYVQREQEATTSTKFCTLIVFIT